MDKQQLFDLIQDIDNNLSGDMFSEENVSKRLQKHLNEDGNLEYIKAIPYCISESRTYAQNLIMGVLVRSGLIEHMKSDLKD
ncbi:hypothetical protein [Staphylococcus nepalensis]|jgi:hypothetical protein|uniref:hypothetical protein n=1 Tax=Staphylococcus nepalensis TaxID=214473 RepID=UPI0011C85175|nr:hypothetical protein [Staphylococcus nepalensis]